MLVGFLIACCSSLSGKILATLGEGTFGKVVQVKNIDS